MPSSMLAPVSTVLVGRSTMPHLPMLIPQVLERVQISPSHESQLAVAFPPLGGRLASSSRLGLPGVPCVLEQVSAGM